MDNNPSTGSSASAQNPPWMNTSLSPHERADLLLAQMTLEEKIEMVHGELPAPYGFYNAPVPRLGIPALTIDRKSTRLNSSHDQISYAVFCLKKKKHTESQEDQKD